MPHQTSRFDFVKLLNNKINEKFKIIVPSDSFSDYRFVTNSETKKYLIYFKTYTLSQKYLRSNSKVTCTTDPIDRSRWWISWGEEVAVRAWPASPSWLKPPSSMQSETARPCDVTYVSRHLSHKLKSKLAKET